MNSANNAVSAMAAYFSGKAAAVNYPDVSAQRNASQDQSNGFDSILSKASNSFNEKKSANETSLEVKKQPQDDSRDFSRVKESENKLDTKPEVDREAPATKEVTDDNAVNDSAVNDGEVKNEKIITDDENVSEKADIPEEVINLIENLMPQQTLIQDENVTLDQELIGAISEKGEEIVSQIAETFDISEEDVVNAMQTLGLLPTDLFNPQNMIQLVTEVTGAEDAIDIITDSDIYTSLQDLMEGAESMKNELMNGFELSEEEFQQATEGIKQSFELQLNETKNPLLSGKQEGYMNPVAENAPERLSDLVSGEKTQAQMKAPVSEEFSETAPNLEDEPIVDITSNTSKNGGNSENGSSLQSGAESSNLFNQIINNITESAAAADTAVTQEVNYTDRAQMENIIRQITERITITQGAEETSMELSLHPASLGNVNILLTSGKDGIIAKFTAQNEIVKEAVENQMVTLQQKFDEQGIKVTSIEVTLASHGFEQNLEQGNDRQPGEDQKGKNVRPLRRINLSNLSGEEIEEPETEAERIAVQMMAANGNSVDYTA